MPLGIATARGSCAPVRTLGAGIPDRYGARATLAVAAPLAATSLVVVACVPEIVIPGVVALGAGQAFGVPALGLLALARVPPSRHGAAAGTFFAWFDAGVGLGGPGRRPAGPLERTVRCARGGRDRGRLHGPDRAGIDHRARRRAVGKLTYGRKANPESFIPHGASAEYVDEGSGYFRLPTPVPDRRNDRALAIK